MGDLTTTTQQQPKSVAAIMNTPAMARKLNGILGNERVANSFASNLISVVNANSKLQKADPMTVVGAAMVAATLNLPIVPTIGEAYVVPYEGSAQFQLGYKGLLQLAMRSGEFAAIIDEVVYEGQLIKKNKFTGEYEFDEDRRIGDKIIGYMARFDLVNGFSKTIYMTKQEVEEHAKRFSKSYGQGSGPWKTDFDAMARKTVLKALFSKYAPKSVAMQAAIRADQAVIKPADGFEQQEEVTIDSFTLSYADNPTAGGAAEEVTDSIPTDGHD